MSCKKLQLRYDDGDVELAVRRSYIRVNHEVAFRVNKRVDDTIEVKHKN